ncbi:hypothetical protein GT901_24495 [Vibrio parahaemolyticus]|uniref:hypothetical protein n=1 Tax=Vibrio parahaemolyticus TaxID=670 RepID=UPI0006A6F8E6|nr:hypothetical protein [Vibrio parahaemolyticus]EGQ8277572.1 hypothetical protein [Vibrio parahaemolyticus]EJG0217745.1 hypothetical protein [Vibrio parahaemolyticus]KOF42104.1 hypothetical protein ACX07_21480 [Vibrio parahaemolyticus]MCS0005202.1 hypothetical protein [Vibrio parahaemolyticus]
MNKVVIIGTSHTTQWNLERHDFSDFVATVVKDHCIVAIAEEIDEKPSVVQRVASELGLGYLNIEPNAEERVALGIYSNLSIIEHDIFMEFDDHESPEALEEIERRKQAGYRLREQEWLNRIKVLNACPLLVVCGANHVEPFMALLQENGYLVQVASSLKE